MSNAFPADLERVRRKIISPKEINETIKKYNLKFKYGVFSDNELKIIKDTVDEFLSNENIRMEVFTSYFLDRSEIQIPIKDLLADIVDKLQIRTYRSCYSTLERLYHPFWIKGRFKAKEDARLLELVEQNGHQWKEIQNHFSKHRIFVRMKYATLTGQLHMALDYNRLRKIVEFELSDGKFDSETLIEKYNVSKTVLEMRINAYLRREGIRSYI